MKFILNPRISPLTYEYKVDGEKLTIIMDGQSETFDFTEVTAEGRTVVSAKLPVCPVRSAVRDDQGKVVVHIDNYIQLPMMEEVPVPHNPAMDIPLDPAPNKVTAMPPLIPGEDTVGAWKQYAVEMEAYGAARSKYARDRAEWLEKKAAYDIKLEAAQKAYEPTYQEYLASVEKANEAFKAAEEEFKSKNQVTTLEV